jgi:AraC family transcriptional regulator, regulatory protein of adaptative response / methylated-DNA-[protein]-cysteine methyltransferase
MRRLKGALRESQDFPAAVYDAGFGSSSRVSSAPTRCSAGCHAIPSRAQGVAITYATVHTALGLLAIGATDRDCASCSSGNRRRNCRRRCGASIRRRRTLLEQPHPPDFTRWITALNEHLEGARPRLNVPLDIRATASQMRVWNHLQSIPYGEVQSYGEVAGGYREPSAVRAVARACASNTVALAIPCHRVIRGTGELGGYRWGLTRKRGLIDRERAQTHPERLRGKRALP